MTFVTEGQAACHLHPVYTDIWRERFHEYQKKECIMKASSSLSTWQKQYAGGELTKKELESLIFQYLLEHQEHYRLFEGEQERWVDFLSWIYPRLSRAIDLYKEKGAGFDAYLAAVIKWASKDYRITERMHYITERVCWQARAEEMAVHSEEPVYGGTVLEEQPWAKYGLPEDMEQSVSGINPRQVLMLLLKTYHFVSEDFLDRAATAIGMEKEKVREMVEEIRTLREEREMEIHRLRERIHLQYYRCLVYQKHLTSSSPLSAFYETLQKRYARARKRLQSMKGRLARISRNATNGQIAQVLGVSKSSVDSAIYNLKTNWHIGENGELHRIRKRKGE